MKKLIHFMVIFFIIVSVSSSFGQIRPGAYSISPFVGGYLFEGNQDLDHRPVYGLRLGYDFTKNWGAEAVVDYVWTKYRTTDVWANTYNYRLEGLYHFMPESKLVPFLSVGAGGNTIDYNDSTPDKTRAAVDYGAGLKYFLTDWLALRADVRHVLVFGTVYNNLEYTLGLTFYFGGSKQAPATVEGYQQKPEAMAVQKAEEKVSPLISEPKAEEKASTVVSEPATEEKIITIALGDVHFGFDKSSLTEEAKMILKRNIQILKENPAVRVRIQGHTSASGPKEYNQRLSERRAISVKKYLVKEGSIGPERLSTIGYGMTRPAVHETNPKDLFSKAAKANMRALFEIIVKPEPEPRSGVKSAPETASALEKTTESRVEEAAGEKKAVTIATGTPPGNYSVQVGFFANGKNAFSLVERLKHKGYDAFIRKESVKSAQNYNGEGSESVSIARYRVLVGKFDDAKKVSAQATVLLNKEGMKSLTYRHKMSD